MHWYHIASSIEDGPYTFPMNLWIGSELDSRILLSHLTTNSFPKEKYTLQSVSLTVRFNFAIIHLLFIEAHGQLSSIVNRSCIESLFYPWTNRVFVILTSFVSQFGKASASFRTTLLPLLCFIDMIWSQHNLLYFLSFIHYPKFTIMS
jgi:hypothetical protein